MSLRNKVIDIKSLKKLKKNIKEKNCSLSWCVRFASCWSYKLFSICKKIR